MKRLLLLLLTLSLSGCVAQLSTDESPLPPPVDPEALPSKITWPRRRGPKMQIFFGNQAASVEEAQERVKFEIAVPRVLPEGYELIWVGTSLRSFGDPEGRSIFSRLVYSDGQGYIIIHQVPHREAPTNLTDEYLSSHRQQRVSIHGHPGMGHDRGMTAVPIYVVPAQLQWWPPDQMRIILLDDENMYLTLADLIATAESMEPTE